MTWASILPIAGIVALAGPATGPTITTLASLPVAKPAKPSVSAGLVVVDPGHGACNGGAPGVDGIQEKYVTLAIAQRLVGHLEARGIPALLTRSDDSYLTLRQRMRLANQRRAALFVSIHANASGTGSALGFETHVLSVEGTQIDTPALRGHEGAARVGVDSDVAALLDAVEHGVAQHAAADLAQLVDAELSNVRGSDHSRGVRQDSHHVLLGATMPAVLVEVGFLDHPIEGAELARSDVQNRIAEGLARAVARGLGVD